MRNILLTFFATSCAFLSAALYMEHSKPTETAYPAAQIENLTDLLVAQQVQQEGR